jgi:hypothetical protein
MAAIFAPTMSALEGSVTLPVREAFVDWALAGKEISHGFDDLV